MTRGATGASIVVAALLALAACKDVTGIDPVIRIQMTRTKCEGDCPVYTLDLTEDGRVEWTGDAYVKTRGKKEFRIDPKRFHSVATEFDALGFDVFHNVYPGNDAGPGVTVLITRKSGKMKRVEHHYDSAAPGEMEALEHGIDEVAGTEDLVGKPNEHEAYKKP